MNKKCQLEKETVFFFYFFFLFLGQSIAEFCYTVREWSCLFFVIVVLIEGTSVMLHQKILITFGIILVIT